MNDSAPKLAIVGAGPTALYVLHELARLDERLDITVYEAGSVPGVGFPYGRERNSLHLLSNIASVEIPPLGETFADWLRHQPDVVLRSIGVDPEDVSDTAYYPRVALGGYFRAKFDETVDACRGAGTHVRVLTDLRVTDVRRVDTRWAIDCGDGDAVFGRDEYDVVVLATGHQFDEAPRRDGVRLIQSQSMHRVADSVDPTDVGILGSSLSAIDAAVCLATRYGRFDGDVHEMTYRPFDPDVKLRITMMSRNGLLPEADFFYTLPFDDNVVFTEDRIRAEIERGEEGLLDRLFDLLVDEMRATARRYLTRYDLVSLDADSFAGQHLAERRSTEPFLWARLNLAEAAVNHEDHHVVPWRSVLLRCHELFGTAVPHLGDEDVRRFNSGLRSVFVDNYASVPLLSVRRMLALHDAGILQLVATGDDYVVEHVAGGRPYRVRTSDRTLEFSALVNACGQTALPVSDLPFPSLRAALSTCLGDEDTVPIDDAARIDAPGFDGDGLYFWGLPFLLRDRPFVQGLTASHEIATRICSAIAESLGTHAPASSPAPAGAVSTSPGAVERRPGWGIRCKGSTVFLSGEIDAACMHDVQDAIGSIAPGDVVVDMAEVSFVDSSGLRVLIEAWQARTAAGSRLVVASASPAARRLLELAGIGDRLGLAAGDAA